MLSTIEPAISKIIAVTHRGTIFQLLYVQRVLEKWDNAASLTQLVKNREIERIDRLKERSIAIMSLRDLSPELAAIAKNELGEDEGKLQEHIEHIKEWLEKQPHIKARMESQWIATFLRGCKHSLEKTKEKLDAYYTMRTHLPELFANRDPKSPKINELLDLGGYLPLPDLPDPNSPRIILLRSASYDPSKYNFVDVIRVNFILMDILLIEDDRLSIVGQKTIQDLSSARIDQVAQYTSAIVKKSIKCFQDAYPLRVKSTHFVNSPSAFNMIFNIFKPFMKEKQRNRIMIHSDMDALHKHIPREILPSDYGGNGASVAELTAHWKQKALDYRDWFMEDKQFGVDESKRIGKKISEADLFGVEGSFKQLSID